MSEWTMLRLGDAITVKHGYAFKGEYFSDVGPGGLLVTPGNFAIGGGFQIGKAKYYDGPMPDGFILDPGAIVVTMTDLSKGGDTLGYSAKVPNDGRIYLHNQRIGLTQIVRPDLVDRNFLYYSLQTPLYRSHVLAGATGSTVRHTSPSRIYDYVLRLPGLDIQRMIAAILGIIDEKIAVNEQVARTAFGLASAMYRRYSEERSSWRAIRLADTARWYSGGTPTTSEPLYWGGATPWISAASLKSSWIDHSERRITALGAVNGTRLVPAGTVIFVVRGSSLKDEFRIGITQREVAFGQDCKALLPVEGVSADVLFHAIKSRSAQILEMVDETSIGAGRLATELIQELPVMLPSSTEDRVVDELRMLNRLAAARQGESRLMLSLRDALLPRLMSGEIRVRDAEREVENAL